MQQSHGLFAIVSFLFTFDVHNRDAEIAGRENAGQKVSAKLTRLENTRLGLTAKKTGLEIVRPEITGKIWAVVWATMWPHQ